MRLDKYLAEAAQCTRSESREAIRSGRVSVNGAVCKRPEQQVSEMDSIQLDGKSRPRQAFVYIMLNKPAGVVSASSDRRDTTVVDLVRSAYPRRELFPAGRLDKTSTGFAHDILAPRRHVPKTYRVTLDTPLTGEMVEGFAAGVVLMDNVRLAPAEVEPLSEDKRTVRVVLHQGVYHQIKRMFGVYGAGVNALHREAIGGVALDEALAPGQWRELTGAEVAAIAGR